MWNESREMYPAEVAINGTLFDMTKKLRGIRLHADNTPKGFRNSKIQQTVLELQ